MTEQNILLSEYIDVIRQYSGYDFQFYSSSLNQRIESFMTLEKISSPEQLESKLLDDELFHMKLLEGITVRFTGFFRDPTFYIALRDKVLPYLATFSNVNILIAGCATGEEAYSLAILLDEHGLNQFSITATDLNVDSLAKADAGKYDASRIREYSINYKSSGGKFNLGRYYNFQEDQICFNSTLKNKIIFKKLDLVVDPLESVYHLILCRNVLFYFTSVYQDVIISKLLKGIHNYGYFATGLSEHIRKGKSHTCIDSGNKLYRKNLQL